jgi:hypothetical protein
MTTRSSFKRVRSILLIFFLLTCSLLISLENLSQAGEWYFAWGYNRSSYSKSDIHVSQSSLGNDFTVHSVEATDFSQNILGNSIFTPQFNARVGYFFSEHPEWGLEFSLDHTKLSSAIGQTQQISGTLHGQPVDFQQTLDSQTFKYNLHNGFNHLIFSLIRRKNLTGEYDQNLSLTLLLKMGAGVVIPHADNTIFGNASDVGPKTLGNAIGFSNGWWQLKGWTAGAEVGLRLNLLKPIFFEVLDKLAYTSMSGIPVYLGRANQSLWMNEWAFILGATILSHPSQN